MASDFLRIRDNVQKMVDQNAPVEDINGYLGTEGFTDKEFKLANENYGTFMSAVKRGGKGMSSLLADVLPAMGADLVEKIAPESWKPKIEEYKQRQWKEAAARLRNSFFSYLFVRLFKKFYWIWSCHHHSTMM